MGGIDCLFSNNVVQCVRLCKDYHKIRIKAFRIDQIYTRNSFRFSVDSIRLSHFQWAANR